jgi:hypothetical protein
LCAVALRRDFRHDFPSAGGPLRQGGIAGFALSRVQYESADEADFRRLTHDRLGDDRVDPFGLMHRGKKAAVAGHLVERMQQEREAVNTERLLVVFSGKPVSTFQKMLQQQFQPWLA